MNTFPRKLTAIALSLALTGIAEAATLNSTTLATSSRVTPDSQDNGVIAPIDYRSGYIHMSTDKDSFTVVVSEEGVLDLSIRSGESGVSARLYDSSGRYITAARASVDVAQRVKVRPGTYRLDVQNGSKTKIVNPVRYEISTNFSVKPQQQALVVLLENGGITVDVQENVTSVDMVNILENLANQVGTDVDGVEVLLNQVTDYALEKGTDTYIEELNSQYRKYQKVIILEDNDFNKQKVLDTLWSLSNDYVVDIHVLAHGSKNGFIGEEMFDQGFFEQLPWITPLYLRSVYQMNCYGSYLNGKWVTYGGVEAVNGSTDINWLPPSYFVFLNEWMQGASFKEAVQTGYNDMVPVAQSLYEIVDTLNDATNPKQPQFRVDYGIFLDPQVVPNEELQQSQMQLSGTDTNVSIND